MLIDGKAIAGDIYSELKVEVDTLGRTLHLCVLTAAPNAETKQFLRLKKKRAEELGVAVNVVEFMSDVTTDEVVQSLQKVAETADGLVVQLPFPSQVDTDVVLAAIPPELDVDAVHYKGQDTEILPPVVGAIAEMVKRHQVNLVGQNTVVVGQGRLVGVPAATWAMGKGADVVVVTKETKNSDKLLHEADVIISGAGVSGLLTPDKIKAGVFLFDAGTSEEAGELKGDADPSCADKCELFTPVPGGIGPVTVAVLLKNLVLLAKR